MEVELEVRTAVVEVIDRRDDRAAGRTRGAGDGVGLGDWSGCGIFVRHDSCRCVRALASRVVRPTRDR